jgi:hypothetical protein
MEESSSVSCGVKILDENDADSCNKNNKGGDWGGSAGERCGEGGGGDQTRLRRSRAARRAEAGERGVRSRWAVVVWWAGCWSMWADLGEMENGPGTRSTVSFSYLLKKFPKESN